MPELRRVDSNDPEFILLTQELTKFLAILDGEDHAFFHAQNSLDTIPHALVLREDGIPVACGAIRFKEAAEDQNPLSILRNGEGAGGEGIRSAEIKRMFVRPAYRGRGYSKIILNQLEEWARELGAKETILETSVELEAALQLYQSSGYSAIPNYPPYVGVEKSRCFRKPLT